MRSYALFLALAVAVLHARAATIPAPDEKKIPVPTDALDDVSLDKESEPELVKPTNPVQDVENNLRNSIPENVPVKIIEEQPVIKKIPLTEDSNDYVPDNDDSSNIKRVEIDLNNPGPPQRQEHDSQQPAAYLSYIAKERAVAAIKQSIEESQNIFTQGIQDVTQKFKYYFANNDGLDEVSKNIQSLRQNFDAEVVKLSKTINSYLKPESEGAETPETPSNVKEVENGLKSLEKKFDYGIGMLAEGVELLSILKEEDDENLKIAGKADNENTATGPATGTGPANPANTGTPAVSNPILDYLQNLNNTVMGAFSNMMNTMQNYLNPNSQQNPPANGASQGGFNPASFFQGINFPNFFQPSQNQNPQPQQGTPAVGAQADDPGSPGTPQGPNLIQGIQQQLSTGFQNFFNGINQGITNLWRPQQASQQNTAAASGQSAGTPVATQAVQGTNSVPVVASVEPAKPPKSEPVEIAPVQSNSVPSKPAQSEPAQSEPAQSVSAQTVPAQSEPAQSVPAQSLPPQSVLSQSEQAQSDYTQSETAQTGPIQQMVQNNPIVKRISNAVQRIQGLSNPSKPRETVMEPSNSKGHDGHGSGIGDSISRVDDMTEAAEKEPEKVAAAQEVAEPSSEQNKTE